jgi:hypothetical protein
LLMKTPNVCFMTGETMAAWYATQVPPSAA